jgi:hypothetical protein
MATAKTKTEGVKVTEPVGPVLPNLPSDEEIAAARAERKAAGTASALAVGTVLGLPEEWVAAKIDPAIDEGRKAVLRATWKAKGWIQLDGIQQVVGYPHGAEVWVKKRTDYEADRKERDDRMVERAKAGEILFGLA